MPQVTTVVFFMLTATSQCIRFGVTVTVTSITVFPATQHLYYPTLRMSPQRLTHTSQIPILLQWSYDGWKPHCFHWPERWDPCCWPIPLQIHFRFLHPLLHMTMYESEAWRGQGAVVRGNCTWTMTVGRLSGTPREVTELRRMEKSGCGDQATTSLWLHEEGGTAHTRVLLCVGTGNAGCALCSETTNRQQCCCGGVGFCYVLPSKWRKDPNNGNEAQVHRPQLSVGTFTAPGPSEEQHDGAQADHEVSTVPWEVFWCVCGEDWWWEVLDRGRTGWVGYRRGKPCSHWTCFLAFYCQLPTSTVHLL